MLRKAAHYFIRLRLDMLLVGGAAVFALGMVLGVVFGLSAGDDEPVPQQQTARQQAPGQYSVPVRVRDEPQLREPGAYPDDPAPLRSPDEIAADKQALEVPEAVPDTKAAKRDRAKTPEHEPEPDIARSTPRRVQKAAPEPNPKPTPRSTPQPAPQTMVKPAPPPEPAQQARPAPRRRPAPAPIPEPEPEPEHRLQPAPRGNDAPWLKFAAHSPAIGSKPAIAIVVDDLGLNQRRTRRAIALPKPLTLAFIPYGYNLPKLTTMARNKGHELLVHLPMEPVDEGANPGRNALLTTLTKDELITRLHWNLSRFQGFVGINNHMGSKFTAWGPGLKVVLETLKSRGLLFLDSKTSKHTAGPRLANALRVPHAIRDVFLDNDITTESIERQLGKLEEVARKNGIAIGIGHPYDETVSALRRWIPAAKNRGFVLVPISAIVRRKPLSG